MNPRSISPVSPLRLLRELAAVVCIGVIAPGTAVSAAGAQTTTATPQTASTDQSATKLSPDQLDSLVAPIALYPDPMLSQTLMASTYPLEVIQLQQWLGQNKNLTGKALADAVQKQDWDPSIQSLAGLPEVVKLLSENIKWTTDLGNAFLAQQDDLMAAVQRMRQKAKSSGNLKSSEQQKVEVQTVESKQVIVIEQANPEVVYVPSYNPTVVYGAAPVYAYPPIAYPPPGYYAAGMAISFGVGVAMGAFWGGGGWCCGCGWGGGNNVYINNNNNFTRNANANFNRQNIGNGNRQNIGNGNRASQLPANGRSNWQHNPQHRGGAPYSDRQLANKYGGTARGDSLANRQNNARQNIGRQQGQGNFGGGNRQQGAGNFGGGNRQQGAGNLGGNRQQGGLGDRGGASTRDVSNRTGGGNFGGGDRVGNQRVPNSPGGGNRSAFGGSGTSGRDARASQSRGSSSFGGSRGGGGGGGRRGGGGGRRR